MKQFYSVLTRQCKISSKNSLPFPNHTKMKQFT